MLTAYTSKKHFFLLACWFRSLFWGPNSTLENYYKIPLYIVPKKGQHLTFSSYNNTSHWSTAQHTWSLELYILFLLSLENDIIYTLQITNQGHRALQRLGSMSRIAEGWRLGEHPVSQSVLYFSVVPPLIYSFSHVFLNNYLFSRKARGLHC